MQIQLLFSDSILRKSIREELFMYIGLKSLKK